MTTPFQEGEGPVVHQDWRSRPGPGPVGGSDPPKDLEDKVIGWLLDNPELVATIRQAPKMHEVLVGMLSALFFGQNRQMGESWITDIIDSLNPAPVEGANRDMARLVNRLDGAGALNVFPRRSPQRRRILEMLQDESTTLGQLVDFLYAEGVSPTSLATELADIEGGPSAFRAAGAGADFPDDPFRGQTLQNVFVTVVGQDGEPITQADGHIMYGNIQGEGATRLGISKDEGRRLGITEGDLYTVGWFDEIQGLNGTTQARVFFSDSEDELLRDAFEELGGAFEPDEQEIIDLLNEVRAAGTEDFIGADPNLIIPGLERLDPRHPRRRGAVADPRRGKDRTTRSEIPRLFRVGDEQTFTAGWSPEAVFELQERLVNSHLANMTPSGVWTNDWAGALHTVMRFANENGLAASKRTWTGLATDPLQSRLATLDLALEVLGSRFADQPIPQFEPPTTPRQFPDPVELEQIIQDHAVSTAGRRMSAHEVSNLISHLNGLYRLSYDEIDMGLERDHVREYAARGHATTPAQQQLLDRGRDEVVVNPMARFRQHFEQQFAGAIEFTESQEDRQNLRSTLGETLTMARRAVGA